MNKTKIVQSTGPADVQRQIIYLPKIRGSFQVAIAGTCAPHTIIKISQGEYIVSSSNSLTNVCSKLFKVSTNAPVQWKMTPERAKKSLSSMRLRIRFVWQKNLVHSFDVRRSPISRRLRSPIGMCRPVPQAQRKIRTNESVQNFHSHCNRHSRRNFLRISHQITRKVLRFCLYLYGSEMLSRQACTATIQCTDANRMRSESAESFERHHTDTGAAPQCVSLVFFMCHLWRIVKFNFK